MRLIHELQRRNVFRVAAGYAALSWLVIQIAETVLPAFGHEDAVRLVVIVMAIGLVPVLALSWAFELTPDGLKLDREVDRESVAVRRLDKRLDRVVIVILALAVGYFAFDKFVLDPARDEALRQAALETGSADSAPARRLGETTLVTDFPGAHSEPTLSPDGTRMAFVSPDDDGVAQIWVMGLPDGEPVQITRSATPVSSPSWSPTRDEILFARAADGQSPGLWLVDALGTDAPRIVEPIGSDPSFAPDGRTFVFARRNTVWIGTLDGAPPRQLEGIPPTSGFAAPMPAMNAAGDIAFVLADEGPLGDLWVFEAASGEFRRLTRPEGEWPGVDVKSPAWMPDGKTIVYAAPDGEDMNDHLWRMDTTTGAATMLSTGPGGYARPAVSRDGSRLVYAILRPVWRLVATEPGTGAERIVLESRSPIILPAVSPDGRTVVYFGEHLYTVPVSGGRATQRTFGPPGEATLPIWSESDGEIWYYRGRTLHRLDADTGLSELVLEDFHWSRQHWIAVHGDQLAYRLRGQASFVRNLATDEEVPLDTTVIPAEWSSDGKRLLAWRTGNKGVVICAAPAYACKAVESGDGPFIGGIPRWSRDESRVLAHRALPERPGYGEVWSVPVAGGSERREIETGPYVGNNFAFGISEEGWIVWLLEDSAGVSEIWMSDDVGGF